MDIELSNEAPNWLQQWRSRAGLDALEVDQTLDFKPGTIAHYEETGFSRTPLCKISKLAKLYTVTPFELYRAVELETQRICQSRTPNP